MMRDFGVAVAGPALAAYDGWLRTEAEARGVDFTLYLEPACSGLRLVHNERAGEMWLPDAPATLMLAAMEHGTIQQQMLAIVSAFSGLCARQLLERFDVPRPAPHVLADLGLGDDTRLGFGAEEMTRRFLHAFRWSFFRAANRLRGQLFRQFVAAGLRPGQTVAVVDTVSTGRLPHLAARIVTSMFDVEIRSYAFLEAGGAASSTARALFPVTAFANSLGLPPDTYATATQRSALFSLALGSEGHHAGLDEGVILFAHEKRPDASAPDLVSPLFTRLCAQVPQFPGPLPNDEARLRLGV